MEGIWRDCRYAVRTLRRTPLFTAVTLLSLALGIGANSAIFSLIDTLVLRPLPVRDPNGLVELLTRYPGERRTNGFAWKYYEYFRDRNQVFSDLFGMAPARLQIDSGGGAESIDAEYVTGNFFTALGIQPGAGRLIRPDDDRTGSADAAVVILSWQTWRRRFGADPGVIGRRFVVNGAPAAVVGVAPEEFVGVRLGTAPELWLPIAMEPLTQRSSHRMDGTIGLALLGRLKPHVTIDQARADLASLDRWRVEQIAAASGNYQWRRATIDLAPAAAGLSILRDWFAGPLAVLMGAVGVLLLLACANVGSLLLARAAARQREMSVRLAIGAGRRHLVRLALAESLLLSGAGGLLGVALAYYGAPALAGIMTSGRIVGLGDRFVIPVSIDRTVLAFTAAVSILSGLLFGLAPAVKASAFTPAAILRGRGAIRDGRSSRLFGHALVATQAALSIVLVTAAALFAVHLSNLRDVNTGFVRSSVLLVRLDPRASGYDRSELTRRYRQLIARLESIAGVRSVTLSGMTPIQGAGASRFVRVENFEEKREDRRYVALNWIGPRYFETLGTRWIAGRDFTFEDAGRPRVAIVNESAARYYFGRSSPLGRHFTFEGEDKPYEIVGVASDAKYLNLHEPPPRTIYMNAFQEGQIVSQFALRTAGPPSSVAPVVRRVVAEELKTVQVAKVTTMVDQVNASLMPERLVAILSILFAALGMLLAAVGVYGLLSYIVARRSGEIGIRMALGATERDLIAMVLSGALRLVAGGILAGVPMALAIGRIAGSVIPDFAVNPLPPIVVAVAAVAAVAMAGAWLPARRAARIQPVEAMRRLGES